MAAAIKKERLNSLAKAGTKIFIAVVLGCLAWVETSRAQSVKSSPATNEIRIVELQGTVEVSPAGAKTWVLTQTNQVLHPFDRLKTGPNSRVALRWSDQSILPFGASTELEIRPPQSSDGQSGLNLVRGIISFFHRDKPGHIRIITRGAVAGVEGTEFVMEVTTNEPERTILSVVDGRVQFGNDQATLLLTNGQQAVAEPNQAPVRTAGFIANNVLQWCFYYPAVLDPVDLPLSTDEQSALSESLDAYRAGNLLNALAKYPSGRQPGSDAERVYYAALLLSVGQVEETEKVLASVSTANTSGRLQRVTAGLRQLISAVKRDSNPIIRNPQLTTELLASSYYQQSQAIPDVSLQSALNLARQATVRSPMFGFAWARVAELEFGFGRMNQAMEALDKSLVLAPENAQALALKGFVLAAQGRTSEAITWFDRALALDSALGNAWLGRGLCRIRWGDTAGGREDLLVAAALEPQRAELRSYLGKAYATAGDYPRAAKEIELGKRLDPHDPTAWLYSALLDQRNNRINEAIGDLETSEALNENRSVYRSQLLLDQDQAVRSANLAGIYQDAGMFDVAAREAARAVNYDYANYSAHLFLANSYNSLSDPNLVNRRYETSAENEFLLANLLAPVSAGAISPTISQREYSPLFQRDHLGIVSDTEYLSRGAWSQAGAQYGTFENFNYSLEGFYRSDPGQRPNNDIEERYLSLGLKHQLTPQDSVFFEVKDFEAKSGDLFQYYNQNTASRVARVKEDQEPIVGVGLHHEWSPGVHTLFFGTRLKDRLSVTNYAGPTLIAIRPDDTNGVPGLIAIHGLTTRQRLVDELKIYSAELQQIWEQPDHTTIIGAGVQYGDIDSRDIENNPSPPYAGYFPDPGTGTNAADQRLTSLFKRFSVYGYHQWQLMDELQLIGGLAYDRVTFPENIQSEPVSSTERTVDQFSPKAGLIFRPAPDSTVRFAYARSLAGASLDQSYRLEPSQVAGFIQSFRSIIPESVAGPSAGARFDTYGLSLEQKLCTRTYLGVSGELLNSQVHRTIGAFDVLDADDFAVPSGLRQHLDYDEQSLLFTANQLICRDWSVGARYRLSRAVLKERLVGVPDSLPFNSADSPPAHQRLEGILHQLDLFTIWNLPCGFFAEADALWYAQDNRGANSAEADDDFWQFNASLGYRFLHRRAEASIALLNITDQDYKLDPINTYNELPRERTLAVRFRLNF